MARGVALAGVFALVAAAWAGAASPPPRFWSVGRCEVVLHAHDRGASTRNGWAFHIGLAVCVGAGGPTACRWTVGHRSRLYSEFTVFSRSRYIGGVVRSWTLATRARPGFIREGGRTEPADYYMSPLSVKLLAGDATPARFHEIVARFAEQEKAAVCTGA